MPLCWSVQPGGVADGSRWSFRGRRGKRPPDTGTREDCIPEGCQNRACVSKVSLFPSTTNDRRPELWHPFWVQGQGCVCPVVGPLHPSRPPATICQPSGLLLLGFWVQSPFSIQHSAFSLYRTPAARSGRPQIESKSVSICVHLWLNCSS